MPIQTLTVYCSSSKSLAPHYYSSGEELGLAIARQGWKLVYGGNDLGLMKCVADAVRAGGGTVIGVTPQIFVDEGCHDELCEELIITQTMRERKGLLEERGDAFIALPGGLGTMEEILEIIVAKVLKFHDKSIVLLNIADYWNPLLEMFASGAEQGFIKPKYLSAIFVAKDVAQAIDYLKSVHTDR
jgi:uncharacterized protein (TIGR00730 family)